MVNDSEKIRKIIKIIIILVILVVLWFVFKDKVISLVDEVKLKFGTTATETDVEDVSVQNEKEGEIVYVITESSVNIRENAGIDFKSIATAKKDDLFFGTGNEKEASNGRLWYEIYIDEDRSLTGWVSSKVTAQRE